MNKSELVRALVEESIVSRDEANAVVDTFFDCMKNALLAGSRVEIRGLGSFKIKNYSGYAGRNPKTGIAIEVKPKKLPFFKPSRDLKAFINAEEKEKG